MVKKDLQQEIKGAGWKSFLIILLVLVAFAFIIGGVMSLLFSGNDFTSGYGNVALIPISGPISIDSSSSLLSEPGASSTSIVQKIEDADKDPSIKAIVLEINSPGGAPVASKEIADAVKAANKTTVAWVREVGASGAYWVASASDHIVADELSVVGSIGVNGAYLEFSGLLKKYNVSYKSLKAGKYKDMLSPYKNLSSDEEAMFNMELQTIYRYFKDDVGRNRNIPPEVMDELAQGQIFLGIDAKNLSLVDELGGKAEVTAYLQQQLNITPQYREYVDKKGLLDMLTSLSTQSSFEMGRGIGSSLKEQNQAIFTT